jgi:hypothetical protein
LGLRVAPVSDARTLDDYFPPRGPCAFCGHTDARHRLFDALRGAVAAGDPPDDVARAWDVPLDGLRLILALPEEGT